MKRTSLNRQIKRGHLIWIKDEISCKNKLYRVLKNKKLEYTGIYTTFNNSNNYEKIVPKNNDCKDDIEENKTKKTSLLNMLINSILKLLKQLIPERSRT